MYVPPIVASKIETEGIVPGERFQLCKAAVKTGQKRSTEWLLAPVDPDEAHERVADGIAPRRARESVGTRLARVG
jgi:hypothetical protein